MANPPMPTPMPTEGRIQPVAVGLKMKQRKAIAVPTGDSACGQVGRQNVGNLRASGGGP
jgi:hypothetical protein